MSNYEIESIRVMRRQKTMSFFDLELLLYIVGNKFSLGFLYLIIIEYI